MSDARERWLEHLDLYLDGGLSVEEEREFLSQAERDPVLAQRLGEELALDGALARHFGRDLPVRARRPVAFLRPWASAAAAAVVLVAAGVAIGSLWMGPVASEGGLAAVGWIESASTLDEGVVYAAAKGSRYEVLKRRGEQALRLERGELFIDAERQGLIVEAAQGRRLWIQGRGRISRFDARDAEPMLLVSMQSGEARWMDDPDAEPVTRAEPAFASAQGVEPMTRAVGFGRAFAGDDDFVVVPAAEYAFFKALRDAAPGDLERRVRVLEAERDRLRAENSALRGNSDRSVSDLEEELERLAARAVDSDGDGRRAFRELQGLADRLRARGVAPDELIRERFLAPEHGVERRRLGLRLLQRWSGSVRAGPELWDALQAQEPELREAAALALGPKARVQPAVQRALEVMFESDRDPGVRAAAGIGLLRSDAQRDDIWVGLSTSREAWAQRGETRAALRGLFMELTGRFSAHQAQAPLPKGAVDLVQATLLDPREPAEGQRLLALALFSPRVAAALDPASWRAVLERLRTEAPSPEVRRMINERLQRRL